jgi:hypothetical protein
MSVKGSAYGIARRFAGRDDFATRLAHDVEYGVIGSPLRVIPGEQSRSPNCCWTARPSRRSLAARRLRRPTSFPLNVR